MKYFPVISMKLFNYHLIGSTYAADPGNQVDSLVVFVQPGALARGVFW